MIIYLDENISYHIAHGLNQLQRPRNASLSEQIEIKATFDVFGRGVKDEDWLPQAGTEGACVIPYPASSALPLCRFRNNLTCWKTPKYI